MDKDITEINGACHCGTVKFRVRLSDGLHTARRCNCTYCRMRGAVAVSANIEDLQILEGEQALTLYQFNTMTAKHYFCSRCGIYTHHQRRTFNHEYGVNVACLEGLSPFDFAEVPVNEAPADGLPPGAKRGPSVAGWLRYVPNRDDGAA
jgi:hypothetical protein